MKKTNISDIQNIGQSAYRKLKYEVYYETYDLYIKEALAKFECSISFERELRKWSEWLKHPQKLSTDMEAYIGKIDYFVVPKKYSQPSIEGSEKTTGIFLSNDKIGENYEIKEVNYIISCNIHIHLLSAIWTWFVGSEIDSSLSESCYGNRIYKDLQASKTSKDKRLYKYYPTQYAKWRDRAILSAEETLKLNNITMISLDIKQCYYFVDIDWDKVFKAIEDGDDTKQNKKIKKQLSIILKDVHAKYWELVSTDMYKTHEDSIKRVKSGLPIGLVSSKVLCNFHLHGIDQDIINSLNPEFYGRYVDDMLIVLKTPKSLTKDLDNNTDAFIRRFLVDRNILIENESDSSYYFVRYKELRIQSEKVKVFYIGKDQNKAILKNFKKELQKNVSELRFLPEDYLTGDLDNYAYELIVDGSINKLRSINDIKENTAELAKYLSRLIIFHRLSTIPSTKMDKVVKQLFQFFNGSNLLIYSNMWERLFSFFVITNRQKDAQKLYDKIARAINECQYLDLTLLERIQKDSLRYLDISYALPLALTELTQDASSSNRITTSVLLRKTCLVRSQYVCYPLLEYCETKSSLCDPQLLSSFDTLQLDEDKLTYAPRHIHFDEYQLHWFYKCLLKGDTSFLDEADPDYLRFTEKCCIEHDTPFNSQSSDSSCVDLGSETYMRMKHCYIDDPQLIPNISSCKIRQHYIGMENSEIDSEIKLKIALANLRVKKEDVKASYAINKKPNVSTDRQADLYKILNMVKQEKCDLLVLPEFAIPHDWLPVMANWVRKQQIGAVFGMEHWVIKGKAYNFVVTILPYTDSGKHKGSVLSIRLKNHYAPREIEKLEQVNVKIPSRTNVVYDLFNWKGIQFAPYLCYELTDIKHRGLFLSELDMLIACVYNQDTSYFADILDSACRDLHCYIVQANSSEYGDSCIIQPTKSVDHDIIRVKGGDNNTILTATLDIGALREFQCLTLGDSERIEYKFKHLPPGYNRHVAKERHMKFCKRTKPVQETT